MLQINFAYASKFANKIKEKQPQALSLLMNRDNETKYAIVYNIDNTMMTCYRMKQYGIKGEEKNDIKNHLDHYPVRAGEKKLTNYSLISFARHTEC